MNSIVDSDDNDENQSNKKDDSIVRKKDKLKRQIKKLKSIILEASCSLDISKFKDVEKVQSSGEPDSSSAKTVPDVNARLQNELFRYAGFYCSKFSKDNYIFNFSPSHKYEKENQFAVQILNQNGKGSLGKWVMPMSVDMDMLVSITPIDNLQNVPPFLKICKHHIDAYYSRSEQYESLLNTVSQVKNCAVQSNLGYSQISLELMGVHDIENDVYLDVIIYLMYNSEESRPYKVEVDLKTAQTISDHIKKPLYASVKCFKALDLSSAFDQVLSQHNGPFVWSKVNNDDDSPLEVNNLSNSDEDGFLEKYASRDKSLTQHKRRRKIPGKERVKRQRSASKALNVSNKNENSSKQKKRKHDKETSKDDLQRKSSTEVTTNKEKSTAAPINTVVTPLNTEKHKLRQAKLKFNLGQEQKSTKDDSVLSKNELPHKIFKNRKDMIPLTSTPVHKSLKPSVPSNFDISDITVSEKNSMEAVPQKRGTVPGRKIRVNTSSPMYKKKQVTKKKKQK